MKFFLTTFFVFTLAAFFITLYGVLFTPQAESASVEAVAGAVTGKVVRTAAFAIPSDLSIPTIGVSADMTQVGIAKSGRMATPLSFSEAAWYKYGPSPGEPGNAVIAGHLDNALGLPGVFSRLHELEEGDDIYVNTEKGTRLHFKVTDIKVMSNDTTDTEVIFRTTGEPHLVLITCEGTWNQEIKEYSDRLAVFAVLVR